MTLIYFILILGVIIFIHELGHFIMAKRAGVYVYEFALGMGPKLYSFKRKKDETVYVIRALPIGGFVSMAGEEVNDKRKVKESKKLYAKPWKDRFFIIVSGVVFNFILAWVLLFVVGLINGAPSNQPIIKDLIDDYPIAETDIQPGDQITAVNDVSINTIDRLLLELHIQDGQPVEITYERDGQIATTEVAPEKEILDDGEEVYRYGFFLEVNIERGFFNAMQFAFTKSYSLLEQMVLVITYLFQGVLSLDSLSGPVGIFSVVGESASAGFMSLILLTALISINVGFINLLPLPALDGGRLWFLIIEKIKGSPVDPQVENIVHAIGFIFLIGLIVYITLNDIINLF